MPIRDTLKLIYRTIMIAVTVVLGIGTVAAWWYATPANGLLLVSGILAFLTLMAGLSIFRLDLQDAEAEVYRSMAGEIMSKASVKVSYAEPEVHRVDAAGLDDAKRMAAEGASIDAICRAIDPEHDSHDSVHQEAFRKIVRAMIEEM